MLFEIDPGINLDVKDYNSIKTIEVLDSANINYEFFFRNFMFPNIPCIIKGISTKWECSKLWITNDGKIDIDYLQDKYGSDSVFVYSCQERYYNSQKFRTINFKDYLYEAKQSELNISFPRNEYLKNWHLKLNHGNDNFYKVPIFFASDWLNEFYLENTNDDYRFVYMGPEKTWTPFHADVFTSYSWSVNVCGRKKWLLFPPGEEKYLKDELGNLPYDLMPDGSTPADCILNRKYFEVVQNTGEVIFVPSGWHHEVWNLHDTISVNHNWINGCNIQNMYDALLSNLSDIKNEIKDCSDMDNFDQHCQIMLNTLFGMDFKMFYEFLKFIATKRIEMIKDESVRILFHGHAIGLNHILFDLNAIKKVLVTFVQNEDIKPLEYFSTVDQPPQRLLQEINLVLKSVRHI